MELKEKEFNHIKELYAQINDIDNEMHNIIKSVISRTCTLDLDSIIDEYILLSKEYLRKEYEIEYALDNSESSKHMIKDVISYLHCEEINKRGE